MALLTPLAWLALLGMSVPLSGTVEDGAGKPVAGAIVWLGDTNATRKGPEVIARAETDDQGRFRLERPDDLAGRGAYWSPTLWAFKPGSRVAFLEFKGAIPGAVEPVRLVLGPPASAPLRVVRADGRPASGVRVRPVLFKLKAPTPPDKMLERLETTTDAEGRASIDGLAPGDVSTVEVKVEGQVVQWLPIDPEDGTVSIRPLGRLKARVVGDDPKALKGWVITASSHPTEPDYRGSFWTHWARRTTGDDGLAEFPPLAEGQIYWDIKPPEGTSYLVKREPSATIRPDQLEEVEIPLVKGVRVEGAILEEPGYAPIAGVKVDAATLMVGSRTVHYLVTDDKGRFSTLVQPGTVRFSLDLHDMPKGYFLPPSTPHWLDFDVKPGEELHQFAPPRLRKAVQVTGRVVDEAGKPAVRVGVSGSWTSAEFGNGGNTSNAQTDEKGEFVLGNLPPKSRVRVSASKGWVAGSEPAIVEVAGEGEPVTLVLHKKPTLALSGRVLDSDGKPLAGAWVMVETRPRDQPFSHGSTFYFEDREQIQTGPDGRFQTPDQIPVGQQYRVEVVAPGFETAESKWVAPPALDIPDVTLRRQAGTRVVTGRVVDSAGRAVSGVEVFQSGDGPKRILVITDAEGRFKLTGVPDTPVLLFAARKGYRFLGQRVDPGAPPVEFSLRRMNEPSASLLKPVAPPVGREEERAIARALIARARTESFNTNQGNGTRREQFADLTALVDPDRALELIENQIFQADAQVLADLALARSEADPKQALEILDAIGEPLTATSSALALFDRLGSTAAPEFRRDLLGRAERRARAIENPGPQATELAKIADRWLDLGDLDRASKLVREAQALAEKPREQPYPDPTDDLALALARVDLPAALKLVESHGKNQEYQIRELRIGLAKRLATTDPAAARRIIATVQDQWQTSARREVCLRMAEKDLPAAQALAAEDRDPMLDAILPAIAARARAGTDPETARSLLLDSIERLGKLDPAGPSRPSPAVALARLVPLAVRIDPDRAPGYLWFALARRPALSSQPERMPVTPDVRRRYLDLAELAVLVGRYDRQAAEVAFAPVAARLVGMDDEHWGLGGEGPALFTAAGAFDARTARTLLDALPEDPPSPPPGNFNAPGFRHHSKAEARIALARSLGLPPRLRLGPPSQPGIEDRLGIFDE